MRILHTADWHVGRQLAGRSFLGDQKRVLTEIAEIARRESVDVVVIAGDLYDRANPGEDAVQVLGDHLEAICRIAPVIAIAGNHDSGPRLDFGRGLLRGGRLHLAGTAFDRPETVCIPDQHGEVSFHLMPYATPERVRAARQDPDIRSHADATRARIEAIGDERRDRAVLVGHLFVTGGQPTESSERDISVGGVSDVPSAVFESFQYTALGHLHRPHSLGEGRRLRYAGSPIAYSFGEQGGAKSVSIVDLDASGGIEVEEVPLLTAPAVVVRRGAFDELMASLKAECSTADPDGVPTLIRVELSDQVPIPDAFGKLRSVHPGVIELGFDRLAAGSAVAGQHAAEDLRTRSPQDFLTRFFDDARLSESQPDLDGEIRSLGRALMEEILHDGGEA